MKRFIIVVLFLLFLFTFTSIAEDVSDIIPSNDMWGMSREELAKSLTNIYYCDVGGTVSLLVPDLNINFYPLDAYYVFDADMGTYKGLSKITYLLPITEDLTTDDIKECRDTLIEALKDELGEPESEKKAVTTWKTDNYKVELGTGKFKKYNGSDNFTVGIVIKPLRISNNSVTTVDNMSAAADAVEKELEKTREATDVANIRAAYAKIVSSALTGELVPNDIVDKQTRIKATSETAGHYVYVAEITLLQTVTGWQSESLKLEVGKYSIADLEVGMGKIVVLTLTSDSTELSIDVR